MLKENVLKSNPSQKKGIYIWVIDQACSVKMAGYWLCSFLRVYGPRQVYKLAKKK